MRVTSLTSSWAELQTFLPFAKDSIAQLPSAPECDCIEAFCPGIINHTQLKLKALHTENSKYEILYSFQSLFELQLL